MSFIHLGLLVAAGVSLHWVETLIPVAVAVPGAKLGLANVVTLLVVVAGTPGQVVALAAARTLLSSLLQGRLLSLSFWLGLSGGMASALAMVGARRALHKYLSLVGVSLLGAVTHNLAQLVVLALLVRSPLVFHYLPILLLLAAPSGLLTGLAAQAVIRRMRLAKDS